MPRALRLRVPCASWMVISSKNSPSRSSTRILDANFSPHMHFRCKRTSSEFQLPPSKKKMGVCVTGNGLENTKGWSWICSATSPMQVIVLICFWGGGGVPSNFTITASTTDHAIISSHTQIFFANFLHLVEIFENCTGAIINVQDATDHRVEADTALRGLVNPSALL